MDNAQGLPHVVLMLDRERRWQLDASAFERAGDGFEEVGLTEYADNPMESLQVFEKTMSSENANTELEVAAKTNLRLTRKVTKVFRVWVWAGLTGEDPDLLLSEFSKRVGVGQMPKLFSIVIPVLMSSLVGPLAATENEAPSSVAGDIGLSHASV